ncbi:hypothetical protein AWH60_12365 [Pseudoalteromonas haloplanktis]|nr:hypothetical protein AWH60_12365 [Pseudoalteromonas haloplanktis]
MNLLAIGQLLTRKLALFSFKISDYTRLPPFIYLTKRQLPLAEPCLAFMHGLFAIYICLVN